MIEEMKILLDQIGSVPDVALWVLIGFMAYKLITYLSMTGAVVYIVKMLCTTFSEWQVKPKKSKLCDVLINYDAEEELEGLLKEIRTGSYVHSPDVRELKKAWRAWQEQKRKTEKENPWVRDANNG